MHSSEGPCTRLPSLSGFKRSTAAVRCASPRLQSVLGLPLVAVRLHGDCVIHDLPASPEHASPPAHLA
jgi:hypothetical protein